MPPYISSPKPTNTRKGASGSLDRVRFEPLWKPVSIPGFALGANAIAVWKFDIRAVGGVCLSRKERRTADAIEPGPARMRHVASHSAVRRLAASILGREPMALSFHRTSRGKPSVAGESAFEYSVSHSGDSLLVAVARRPVGIDIEHMERRVSAKGIARRFFPAFEADWIEGLPESECNEAFLRLWVAKEAALKRMGTGIAGQIERAICKMQDGGIERVAVGRDACRVREFFYAPGYLGALAFGEPDDVEIGWFEEAPSVKPQGAHSGGPG